MIHIVSGYMRTGTSMMMQALSAGGLEPAFTAARDNMNQRFGDDKYQPNRGGFYEVPLNEYKQHGFPLQYDGKLIKVMCWGLNDLAVHDYRIVLMRRDPLEIRESYEAAFGQPLKGPVIDQYERNMDDIAARVNNRRDVRLTVLDYRSVVESPVVAFRELEDDGWPINCENAASHVDPQQYRFRREVLV